MKCFNCGYNQIDKTFEQCPVCGVSISKQCPVCETVNPKNAKFCLTCGTSLEKVNKRDRNLKAGVIFADLSGFTSLAETFNPETTKDIINECFRRLTEPVYRHGGQIDKYIGDCVMAVFGMDSDGYDVPLKTIQAALEMREAIHAYHKQLVKDESLDLNVSIGVTYGDVVLGNVGSKHDVDYTVIGDSVNVASRLQSTANPGEIRVGKNIYNNTLEQINFSNKELLSLKNKEDLVESYLAISKINTSASVYVDRSVELDVLEFINSERSKIQITGEAGVGKTILIKRVIQLQPTTKKSIYIDVDSTMGSTFFGVAESILKNVLIIQPNDSVTERKDKLTDYVSFIFEEEDTYRLTQFLSIILKVEVDKSFESIIDAMDYHDLLNEINRFFTLFIERVSEVSDVLIFIDNAHQIDNQSKELMVNLDGICKCVFISREFTFEDVEQINIENFNKNEIDQFISLLCPIKLTDALRNTIHKLSKGYPRYIKALINEVRISNNKADISIFDLNNSLKNSLPKIVKQFYTNQLNQLNDSVKEILEIASVFKDVFSFHKMFIILDGSYDKFIVEEVLQQNIVTEVKYERINDETIYYYRFIEDEFKYVIYESLLDKQKREIHKLICNDLISSKSSHYESLAHHAERSNQLKLASRYYYQAAIVSRKQFDLDKTEKFYEKFLELPKGDSMNVLDGSVELIKVLIYKANFDKALDWIERSKSLNDSDDYQSRLLLLEADIFKMMGRIPNILSIIEVLEKKLQKTSRNYGKLLQLKSSVYNMTGQPGVIELTEQSKELLLKSRDFESLIETLSEAGIRSFIEGNLQKGIEYLEEAMAFANQISNKASLLKVLGNLGIFYSQFGEREKAHVYFKNAMSLAKEISNQRHYIGTEINLAVSYLSIGSFIQAQSLLEEAVQLVKSTNLPVQQCIALTNLGDVYYELGHYDKASIQYIESDTLALNMDMPIDHAINQLGLLKVQIKQDMLDDVLTISNELLKILEEAGELTYLSSLHFILADFYIKKDKYEKALEMIDKSKTFAEQSHDEMQIIRSMRKGIEISLHLDSDKVNDLIEEATAFGEKSNLYYELAKLYVMLYINKPAFNHYIYKAKEMALFFDECQLTKVIDSVFE